MTRDAKIRASIEAQMVAPRAPSGTCRWCGKTPLPARRTRWCSEECSSRFEMLILASRYRPFVFQRAHGRCEACGWNIKQHVSQVARWLAALYPHHNGTVMPRPMPLVSGSVEFGVWLLSKQEDPTLEARRERYRWVKGAVEKVGGRLSKAPSFGLWEVDHIVPVVEGGQHSLENLRLLCRRCHLKETKALAGRRRRK